MMKAMLLGEIGRAVKGQGSSSFVSIYQARCSITITTSQSQQGVVVCANASPINITECSDYDCGGIKEYLRDDRHP